VSTWPRLGGWFLVSAQAVTGLRFTLLLCEVAYKWGDGSPCVIQAAKNARCVCLCFLSL